MCQSYKNLDVHVIQEKGFITNTVLGGALELFEQSFSRFFSIPFSEVMRELINPEYLEYDAL